MKYVAILSLFLLCSCFPNYSEGSRVGTVVKLSHKGLMFKSWEGELGMGSIKRVNNADGSITTTNVFEFSVESQEVVDQLHAAVKSGERVELVYRQWAMAPPTICTAYVITSVKSTRQEK
jgi:hypothetical protein